MTSVGNLPDVESRLLYLAARQQLHSSHAHALAALAAGPVDWPAVLALATEHQVAPLVYHHLSAVPGLAARWPDAVQRGFKRQFIENALRKKAARAALEMAVRLCHDHGLTPMLVKGAALNLTLYQHDWLTQSWDIDIVLPLPRAAFDAPPLRPLLETLDAHNNGPANFKTKFEYDFVAHHDVTMNGVLPVQVGRLWAEARPLAVPGGTVLVPTLEDTLLIAAIGACRKRYFRLKTLCDLGEIARAGVDWARAAEKARAYGCQRIVYAALCVARATVGCPVPEHALAQLGVSPLRAAAVRRVAELMARRVPLRALSASTMPALWGRALSWPLLLTYLSYGPGQIIGKVEEAHAAWQQSRTIASAPRTSFTKPSPAKQ